MKPMWTKYGLPALAIAGLVFAVWVVKASSREVVPAKPLADPASTPFAAHIAGAGLVEARSENIQIGAPVAGIVIEVLVKVGDTVKADQPLFRLDDRELQAQLLMTTAAVQTAQGAVAVADSALADTKNSFDLYQQMQQVDARAVSREEFDRRRFAVASAEARLKQAQGELSAAQAGVKATQLLIDRTVVRAPVAGEVLQVNVRPGEFAMSGGAGMMSGGPPPMMIGDVSKLHVRVDVDENDAWRLRIGPKVRARAFLRGNSKLATDVRFVRIEPYVLPKRNLTGESTERIDTRVLQVLFEFDRADLPVYVGQQMDVFIEAEPVNETVGPKSRT
jgi:HlyD family secretion protein